MKFRIMSDIHLDANFGWKAPTMADDNEQVLIVAGDAAVVMNVMREETFFDYFWEDAVERFKKVLFVPGNHDYYRGNIHEQDDVYRKRLSNIGVDFLQCDIITIDDVKIAGCTLWTDFDKHNDYAMNTLFPRYMRDAQVIKGAKDKVTAQEILEIHKEHAKFLEYAAMTTQEYKNVLITHHLPNEEFVHRRWKNDQGNCFFRAHIDNHWLGMFNLVVCGHTHDNRRFNIGEADCVINPKGYGTENMDFDPRLVIEV